MMKKLLYVCAALLAAVVLPSCNLDFFPDDEINAEVLLSDESGAEYIMDGCYALLYGGQKEKYIGVVMV